MQTPHMETFIEKCVRWAEPLNKCSGHGCLLWRGKIIADQTPVSAMAANVLIIIMGLKMSILRFALNTFEDRRKIVNFNFHLKVPKINKINL